MSEITIPQGMKAWAGGESAPDDVMRGEQGAVLFRDGRLCVGPVDYLNWLHITPDHQPARDIVAYRPATETAPDARNGKLNPCPFCGRADDDMNAVQESAINVQQSRSPAGGRRYRVECCCGASGAWCADHKAAVISWDTRTPTSETDQLGGVGV